MEQPITERRGHREPWNKRKLVGQKAPLRLKEIWAIRIRLQLGARTRELALFNLAVDSKLVKLRVRDVTHGEHIAARAIVMQQKTRRPVQFEVTEQTCESIAVWFRSSGRHPGIAPKSGDEKGRPRGGQFHGTSRRSYIFTSED